MTLGIQFIAFFKIDATVVRAHACASGYQKGGNGTQALGRSKRGFTTKIHANEAF